MKLFRELNGDEIAEFRKWARDNYEPFAPIKGVWHPEVQKECVEINRECATFKDTNKEDVSHGTVGKP